MRSAHRDGTCARNVRIRFFRTASWRANEAATTAGHRWHCVASGEWDGVGTSIRRFPNPPASCGIRAAASFLAPRSPRRDRHRYDADGVRGPDGAYVIPNLPSAPINSRSCSRAFRPTCATGVCCGQQPRRRRHAHVGAIGESDYRHGRNGVGGNAIDRVGQVIDNERVMEIP